MFFKTIEMKSRQICTISTTGNWLLSENLLGLKLGLCYIFCFLQVCYLDGNLYRLSRNISLIRNKLTFYWLIPYKLLGDLQKSSFVKACFICIYVPSEPTNIHEDKLHKGVQGHVTTLILSCLEQTGPMIKWLLLL